jgi:outer membrane protein assembly factor BamB
MPSHTSSGTAPTIKRRVMLNSRAVGLGISALVALMGGPALASTSTAAVATTDWSAYLHGAAHSSADFGNTAITTANAGHLVAAWHFTPGKGHLPGQPGPGLDASPTVVGGVVYIGSRTGMFYALSAATGAVLWMRQLDFGSHSVCAAKGITGTATVAPDPVDGVLTVYAPGAHFLYALTASSGSVRWQSAIGPATASGKALYFNWASPTVAGGRIFIGLAANCESHLIRGGVVSLDQHTGAHQHTYFAVPSGSVGASVWSSEASDGTSVWATTGNPDPTGTQVFDAYSVVRLSASTLARQDKWTVPAPQSADLDFGSSPTLFSASLAGVATPMVAACNKNGVLYAWKQADLAAGPVWQLQVSVSGANGLSCITSPAYDGPAQLLIVAANSSTIAGAPVAGAVRALNPATGAVVWQQALPCAAMGSPTLDAATHLVAVPTYGCSAGTSPAVQMFEEIHGTPVGSLPEGGSVFAQPVFADGQIYVASETGGLTAFKP